MSTNKEVLEDRPVVKKLKDIDDKYLGIQREFELARSELAKRYTEKQNAFLVKRKELLTGASNDSSESGTPALPGFWCKAIQQHEAFEDKVRDWDEPVLEYLIDVEVEKFEPETSGFKVVFRFRVNPYFSNQELSVEYHSSEGNPYLDTMDVDKIVSSAIDWKPGKDVTVEKVSKKAKGGGAKKTKQKTEEQPRASFFSDFVTSLHKGMTLAEIAEVLHEDVKDLKEQGLDEEGLASVTMQLMQSHFECGVALRDNIVPFAVRFYTGEACADDDDDDDDEDEEEEEDSDDEDSKGSGEDDEEGAQSAKAESSSKAGKQEDCKQQ